MGSASTQGQSPMPCSALETVNAKLGFSTLSRGQRCSSDLDNKTNAAVCQRRDPGKLLLSFSALSEATAAASLQDYESTRQGAEQSKTAVLCSRATGSPAMTSCQNSSSCESLVIFS